MAQQILKLSIYIFVDLSLLFCIGSYEILHFPQDTRSLSLHNAASAYDHSIMRNNPAALSLSIEKTAYSYLVLPAGIHSGEIQRIRRIGSGISAGKLSFINYGSIIDGYSKEKTSACDILIELGYKKELKEIFSLGISMGYLLSSITGYHSQLLFANVGIRSRIMKRRIGFGFSLENVGYLITSYTDVKESIPAIFRSALYYRPKYVPSIISIDFIHNLDRDATELSAGLEFDAGKILTFRLGCSSRRIGFLTDGGTGLKTSELRSNLMAAISGGAGFKFNKFNLDVGFMNLGAAGYIIGFSISKKASKELP